MKFSYALYQKELKNRMRELEKAFQEEDLLKTICYLKYLSNFCYSINCKLSDDRLEQITKEISLKYLGHTVIEHSHKNIIIFYDNFGLANRGLANIYVKALEKLGYKIVWILYAYAPDVDEIQKMYKGKENISFRIIPQIPILERMKMLRDIIKEISPRNLFVYTQPNDADGIGAISTIGGNISRYLIDLTDHAFWLGKCAIDWVIGFRNYGYNVAVQYRGILPDKIVILPYYPDARNEHAFEGMPFDTSKYEFIFSGGSPYKIEGNNTYKEIVQYILRHYTSMRFVYAGKGTNQILEELKEEFPNRFYKIDERKDLDAVLQHAKFYLSTYPIGGGLMMQYALQNRCIALSLCDEDCVISDPKSFMLYPEKVNFVFYNQIDLYAEIDHLMGDEEYYLNYKNDVKQQIISENEFITQLGCILDEKKTIFSSTPQQIKMEPFMEIYKKNATYEQYCKIIFDSRNKWIYKKHPFIVRRMKRASQTKEAN